MSTRPYASGPVAPKPFDYIPFARQVEKQTPAGHDRYDPTLLTGYVQGEIVVLTPLYVASGTLELTKRVAAQFTAATPLIKAFVRSGGVRVIPGSTLKGAVRSVIEAITPSTVGKVGRRTQIPSFLREPGSGSRHESNGVDKKKAPVANQLSPADRLFGVMDYLGQVRFSDGRQIDDLVELIRVPSLFAPRAQGPALGRKFYKHGRPAQGNTPCEAAPINSRFGFRCDFDNLTDAELGVLLIALGQGEPALHLKLGGGKPACYGSVRIDVTALKLRRAIVEDYLDWEGTEADVAPAPLIATALADRQLVLAQQLQQLQETLKYPNDRDCPAGNY